MFLCFLQVTISTLLLPYIISYSTTVVLDVPSPLTKLMDLRTPPLHILLVHKLFYLDVLVASLPLMLGTDICEFKLNWNFVSCDTTFLYTDNTDKVVFKHGGIPKPWVRILKLEIDFRNLFFDDFIFIPPFSLW